MCPIIDRFIEYVRNEMPRISKEAAEKDVQQQFEMTNDESVFYNNHFAVRFSYSKNGSFSNTVLALSKLQKYDHLPFFVILIKGNQSISLFLANTTLLQKISHSSQELRMDNIRGSFNGSDIIKEYNHIPNDIDHIEELFAIHQGLTWNDNLSRLVEATSKIEPIKSKFNPMPSQRESLMASVSRSKEFVDSNDYTELKSDLDARVQRNLQAILVASHIENVNIRGRLIEYLITTENSTIHSTQTGPRDDSSQEARVHQ